MIEYEELYRIIESRLSKERFEHSKRVVKRALEYASIYNVSLKEVELVALAHDIAKEIEEDEIAKYKDLFDEIELLNKSLWHAIVGAKFCKEYGFTSDMLNGVRYHTTGRSNMSLLEKIIFLADATEEGRTFGKNYVSLIKEDIDKGMVEICRFTINNLLERNKIIHPDTINCYNFYLNEINNRKR